MYHLGTLTTFALSLKLSFFLVVRFLSNCAFFATNPSEIIIIFINSLEEIQSQGKIQFQPQTSNLQNFSEDFLTDTKFHIDYCKRTVEISVALSVERHISYAKLCGETANELKASLVLLHSFCVGKAP